MKIQTIGFASRDESFLVGLLVCLILFNNIAHVKENNKHTNFFVVKIVQRD
jgi:hypothetical protein